jgi:hypothetical protein
MGVLIGYRWEQGVAPGLGATPVAQADIITMRNGGPLWVAMARIVFEGPRQRKSWPQHEWVMVPGETREYSVDDRWHHSSPGEIVVVTVEWLDEDRTHYAQRWEFTRRDDQPQGNLESVAEPSVADGTLPVAESVITRAERRAGMKPPFEIPKIPKW